MCSVYTVTKPRKWGDGTPECLKPLVRKPEHGLVRPTLQAPVLLGDEARMMRWGFQRPWAKTIHNARTDNLESPVWKKAFETRRCLIPMSGFYEFTGPAGQKRAHLFQSPEHSGGEWLWAAGIWEEHHELGECFSMLMTEAEGIVLPVHDRMPVLVGRKDSARWLSGDFTGPDFPLPPLAVRGTESPLKRRASRRQAKKPE